LLLIRVLLESSNTFLWLHAAPLLVCSTAAVIAWKVLCIPTLCSCTHQGGFLRLLISCKSIVSFIELIFRLVKWA
jgi:hypothetical protein